MRTTARSDHLLPEILIRKVYVNLVKKVESSRHESRQVEGSIKRGMGETIHSVIWFCDLRGFTELSGRLDDKALLALLNDYFGAMTDAV